MQRILALPKYEPVRIDTEDERTYVTPLGECNSVTNILSGSRDETQLLLWKESVGEEQAQFVGEFARFRGNKTHTSIEQYLLHGTEPELDFTFSPYWKSIQLFLPRVEHSLAMEGAVWHPDGYAGTFDCIAYLDDDHGQPTLLDWKTADTKRNKKKMYEYTLQAAAYVKAANYVYASTGIQIERAMVVVALANQRPQIEELNRDELNQLYIHFQTRIRNFNYAKQRRKLRD